jgi:hypothetical protein
MFVQDRFEGREYKKGCMADHGLHSFRKKHELIKFHDFDDAIVNIGMIIVDKAMLAFQVACAHRLEHDIIRIVGKIFLNAQLYALAQRVPGDLPYFPVCNIYCFKHRIKIHSIPT